MIEVETQTTEVEVINSVEVTSTSQVEVETVDLSDLDITVAKKEYVITGDDIYIPMLYDDAPQWMKDLVQVVVDVSISSGNQSLINNMNAILQDFAVSYVPLNQYTQSILDLGDEDTRINALIETLNSNFNDGLSTANAQIISLQLTKASKDEVVAQVIQTIAAQLADGTSNIGSIIGRIDQAIANETSARALSLQTLTASLEDTNLDVTANAEVIQNALAYVGIDEAGASTGTGLSAYLEDSNGNIGGADSQLANSIRVTAEGVESKFAYNSLLNINGVYKKSGFGLTTNYTSGNGTQANPYVSEFWIDASRLKFTNSNQTGQVAPFTIDASGANPQITFNGKVAFSNVTNTTGTGSNLLYNSAPKIGSETKGWYVWTDSGMAVNLSAGFDVWKPTGGASVAANIGGSPSIGSVFDVGQYSLFPVITGSRYEASAYISAHRSNSYVLLVFYDAAGNYAGEASGNVINYAGSSALVSWGRSSVFTTAPSNAATARFIIRSSVTGKDPYCFVTNAFAGVAEANQTTPSNWSEGTSAGATYTSELSNDAGFTTLGAVASQGYVLPAGVANAINTNTTTIHGSKITTESITAAQIAANSVTADKLIAGTNSSTVWTGGGLISQNFNGNPYGDIGSPSAGFRLSSGAAGTSTDPNIYGAYIQGSSVEVNSFKVRAEGYASNFGRLNLVSNYTAIVGRGYSTGFDARRVCSDSVSSIKLDCWARATGNWISAVLEYESNSNGNWIWIADRGMSMYGYLEYAYLNFAEFFNPSLVPTTGYVHFRIRLTSGNNGSTSGVVVTLSNG